MSFAVHIWACSDEETPESAPSETKPIIALSEEPVSTGEEDEDCIYTTDGALFEFVTAEGTAPTWKERGRGELRINLSDTGARMIMRAKGNYRLILNAAMWKDQAFSKMEGGKGISFPCKNAVAGPVGASLASTKLSYFNLTHKQTLIPHAALFFRYK